MLKISLKVNILKVAERASALPGFLWGSNYGYSYPKPHEQLL